MNVKVSKRPEWPLSVRLPKCPEWQLIAPNAQLKRRQHRDLCCKNCNLLNLVFLSAPVPSCYVHACVPVCAMRRPPKPTDIVRFPVNVLQFIHEQTYGGPCRGPCTSCVVCNLVQLNQDRILLTRATLPTNRLRSRSSVAFQLHMSMRTT